MILIDLAAYAHDTNAQMEEVLTLNSFYHPREHDQEGHAHSGPHDGSDHARGHEGHEAYGYDASHSGHAGHAAPAEHVDYQPEDASQGTGAEPPAPDSEYSDKDFGLYQVLLAVERGELSPEDAARKLEELEAGGREEGGAGPI
ncbi:MAG TPA: hypothetical protein VFG99_09970 [Chloroflexia bacterium]|nr:hypothetical protein [Chloroflexia bacterium]